MAAGGIIGAFAGYALYQWEYGGTGGSYRFLFARDRTHDGLLKQFHGMSPVLDAVVRGKGGNIQIHLNHVFGPRPKLLKFRPDLCEDGLTADDL